GCESFAVEDLSGAEPDQREDRRDARRDPGNKDPEACSAADAVVGQNGEQKCLRGDRDRRRLPDCLLGEAPSSLEQREKARGAFAVRPPTPKISSVLGCAHCVASSTETRDSLRLRARKPVTTRSGE